MLSTVLPLLVFWLFFPIHTLSLTELSTHSIVIHSPITPGDTFKTVYIHSLELTPVWEYFQIDTDYEIVLTDTLYESTGAGLPIPIQGQDKFVKQGKQFHIFDIQRRLPSIVLRVNSAYNNRIILNDALTFNLSERLGNTVVRIETGQESLGVFLFRYWSANFSLPSLQRLKQYLPTPAPSQEAGVLSSKKRVSLTGFPSLSGLCVHCSQP